MDKRKFLKTASIFLAGSFFLPQEALALISRYKTDDFSRDSDEVLLARMIFGEAREMFKTDEQYREAVMIGHTALNRAKKGIRGKNLKQVILAPKQYSCFNPNNANLKLLKDPERYSPELWKESLLTSKRILEGKLSHLNYGQDHFHRKDLEEYPEWTSSPKMKKVWGQDYFKHFFYETIV